MKMILCLLFLYPSFSMVFVHDVPIALFRIHEDGDAIKLDVTIDINDFCKSQGILPDKMNVKNIQHNLLQYSSWIFDGKKSTFFPYHWEIIGDHFKIYFLFEEVCEVEQTVEISNTFLNNIDNHSNIIQIDLAGREVDFRLNINRTRLQIDL